MPVIINISNQSLLYDSLSLLPQVVFEWKSIVKKWTQYYSSLQQSRKDQRQQA